VCASPAEFYRVRLACGYGLNEDSAKFDLDPDDKTLTVIKPSWHFDEKRI